MFSWHKSFFVRVMSVVLFVLLVFALMGVAVYFIVSHYYENKIASLENEVEYLTAQIDEYDKFGEYNDSEFDAVSEVVNMLATLMYQESGFNAYAVSPTGDYGACQLNDRYMDYHVEKYFPYDVSFDVYNPAQCSIVALNFLAYERRRLGSTELAFRYYNAGNNVYSESADMYWGRYVVNYRKVNFHAREEDVLPVFPKVIVR